MRFVSVLPSVARCAAALVPLFALATGCDDPAPVDPCADVVCSLEGTSCDPVDGLCHCGAGGPVCDEALTCDAAASACVTPFPAPVCGEGGAWSPGTRAFREATDDWGLRGVLGVRLNVTDVDGDGAPDLLVRRGAGRPDDFAPEGVRRTWLLRNTGSGFEDMTERSGLLAMRTPMENTGRPVEIAAFADVDNDGDLDAYLGNNTALPEFALGETSEILLNDGSGNFVLGPEDSGLRALAPDVPAGASFVDVNRDGFVDLWVPQHNYEDERGVFTFAQDRLLLGDGTGRFTDATSDALLTTMDWRGFVDINEGRAHTRAWGALARDLNGDGLSELLAPSYGRSPNHLWAGRMDAAGVWFENLSVASGYAFDQNQTWEDNEFARCFCQANPGAEGCEGVDAPRVRCANNWNHAQDREAFRLGGNSGATSAGDIDNDGDLDLFTGEIKHWWAGSGSDGGELLVNEGELRFVRPGDDATGLEADHLGRLAWDEGHMTNALFDFDNDGRLDVYIGASDYPGNRGLLFHQDGALNFTQLGTDDFFEHNRSHGVVVLDVDRDGDLDIVVGHSRARCDAAEPNDCYETANVRAFENIGAAGNFLQLDLRGGEGTNAAAIGAQVTLRYGDLVQVVEVDGGHGHYGSQSERVLTVGLGAACEAEVTIRWPDAALTTETYTLPAGHRFVVRQGQRPEVAP